MGRTQLSEIGTSLPEPVTLTSCCAGVADDRLSPCLEAETGKPQPVAAGEELLFLLCLVRCFRASSQAAGSGD